MGDVLGSSSGSTAAEAFGQAVAVGDGRVLVGAPAYSSVGRAYLYDTAGNLLRTFANPRPASGVAGGDQFGSAVAISGSYAVVGSPQEEFPANGSGAAYVFDVNSGALLQTFFNPTPFANETFGAAVALSGTTVVVGAPLDNAGTNASGAVHVYSVSTGFQRTIVNPTPTAVDEFGYAVALDGDTLLVGTPGDDTAGNDNGAVYVYSASTGVLARTLLPTTPQNGQQFGYSVDLEGTTAAVGAPFFDSSVPNDGRAYVFDATSGALAAAVSNPSPATADLMGFSVAVSGGIVASGTPNKDQPGAGDAGAVMLFSASTGALITSVAKPSAQTNEQLGAALAAADGLIIGGAPTANPPTRPGAIIRIDAQTAGPFIVNLTGQSVPHLTLRTSGGNFQLVNADTAAIVAQRAVSITTGIDVTGDSATSETLTLDFATLGAGLSIPLAWHSASSSDALRLAGGSFDSLTVNLANATSGTIQTVLGAGGATIAYDGLALLLLDSTSATTNLRLPGHDDRAALTDDAVSANGLSQLVSLALVPTVPAVQFRSPTALLSVSMGSDDGQLTIGALDSAFAAELDIDAGGGNDSVALSAKTGPGAVRVEGGSGVNSFTGPGGDYAWHITGLNAGNLESDTYLTFNAIQNLTAGAGNDQFVFSSAGQLAGAVDGAGGSDELNYAALSAGVAVDLAAGMASKTGGVSHFERVVGTALDDAFTLSGLAQEQFVTGGGEGAGGDSLRYVAGSGPIAVEAGALAETELAAVHFTGIEHALLAGAADVTFRGTAGDDAFRLFRGGGAATMQMNLEPDVQMPALSALHVQGWAGGDELVVDLSSGSPWPSSQFDYDGGDPTNTPPDKLSLIGGSAALISVSMDHTHGGSVGVDSHVIAFSGVELIDDALSAASREITFTGGAEAVSLSSTISERLVVDGGFELQLTANAPTSSMLFSTGAGPDSITVQRPAGGFILRLDGGADDDQYEVSPGAGLASVEIVDSGASSGDRLVIDGTSGDDSFAISATQTTLAVGVTSYGNSLEYLTVQAGSGADFVHVSPASALHITLDGGTPGYDALPAARDSVELDAQGWSFSLQSGAIVFQGTGAPLPIVLNGAEQVLLAPLGSGTQRFDFNGTTSSPTQSGYTSLLPNQLYIATAGLDAGWITAALGFDRGTSLVNPAANLLRDGHYGARGTGTRVLRVDVPAVGYYLVTATLGDQSFARDQMRIRNADAGAVLADAIDTAAGQFAVRSFVVYVSDGSLDLEFSDQGGSDFYWVANAVEIRPARLLSLGLTGPSGTLDADGASIDTVQGSGATPGSRVTVATTLGTITSADADASYAGTQVLADANGHFSVNVRRPLTGGIAQLTAEETTGANSGQLSLNYAAPTAWRFDFNQVGSPTQAGSPSFVGVLPNSLYTTGIGYGWLSRVSSFDRGSAQPASESDLRRDGHWAGAGAGGARVFRVNLPAGTYSVRVTMGDTSYLRDQMQVRAEGTIALSGINTAPGQFAVNTFSVTVNDAALDLEFSDRGGDPYWVVNGVEIFAGAPPSTMRAQAMVTSSASAPTSASSDAIAVSAQSPTPTVGVATVTPSAPIASAIQFASSTVPPSIHPHLGFGLSSFVVESQLNHPHAVTIGQASATNNISTAIHARALHQTLGETSDTSLDEFLANLFGEGL